MKMRIIIRGFASENVGDPYIEGLMKGGQSDLGRCFLFCPDVFHQMPDPAIVLTGCYLFLRLIDCQPELFYIDGF